MNVIQIAQLFDTLAKDESAVLPNEIWERTLMERGFSKGYQQALKNNSIDPDDDWQRCVDRAVQVQS